MVVIITETIFAVFLIEAYRRYRSFIAYESEISNGGTRRIVKRYFEYKNVYAINFSSFDKAVLSSLIRIASFVLEMNIDFLYYRNYGTTNASGILRRWEAIKNYFINTPIRLPDDTHYRKHSWVASGSYFTYFIDSVVKAILINNMRLKTSGEKPLDYLVLGDVSLLVLCQCRNFVTLQVLLKWILMCISRHINNLFRYSRMC